MQTGTWRCFGHVNLLEGGIAPPPRAPSQHVAEGAGQKTRICCFGPRRSTLCCARKSSVGWSKIGGKLPENLGLGVAIGPVSAAAQ